MIGTPEIDSSWLQGLRRSEALFDDVWQKHKATKLLQTAQQQIQHSWKCLPLRRFFSRFLHTSAHHVTRAPLLRNESWQGLYEPESQGLKRGCTSGCSLGLVAPPSPWCSHKINDWSRFLPHLHTAHLVPVSSFDPFPRPQAWA